MGVLGGDDWGEPFERPLDQKIRIVPNDRFFAGRIVKVGTFVDDIGLVLQGEEAVGKTFRDVELFGGIEYFAVPLAKGRGAFPQVDRDVKDLSLHDADQFALRVRGKLVVEAAQDPFFGAAVVVLNKADDQPVLGKRLGVIFFHEETTVIGKCFSLN